MNGVASGYAIFFTWRYSVENVTKYAKDFHPILCCFKGFFMYEVLDISKEIRETCGAHGYLDASNLTNQIEIWSPNVTLEGDGYVLSQQTTKDIFKRLAKLMKGEEITGRFSYLNDFLNIIQDPPKIKFTRSVETMLEIIKYSLIHQIMVTGSNLRKKNNMSLDEKWNKAYLMDIIHTAWLNAIYISCSIFYEQIQTAELSDGLYNTLLRL